MTERDNSQPRAIQPQSLFASQQFATAIYQSELTYKLRQLGYEIATGRSGAPENQARFTGPVLPRGAKLWSKAGWTSQTRHDAAYIELPGGAKFVLVVFTVDHAGQHGIIHTIAKSIVQGMSAAK